MVRFTGLIAVALVFAGCATVQYYQPPEGLSSESAATVVGSKMEMSAANKDLRTGCSQVSMANRSATAGASPGRDPC